MKKALIIIFLISSLNCFSSVIYPKSLRQITNVSNIIVYGKVLKIDEISRGRMPYHYDRFATIEIIEFLKGAYTKRRIKVSYNSSHSCAPTPKFSVSGNYLIFIWQKDNVNHITGFAYGAKNSNKDEYTFLKARVLEIQEIEKMTDSINQYEQVKSWAMKCVDNPITKIDGAWELSKESIQQRLTQVDKEIILRVLSRDFDYDSDFPLAKILHNDYMAEIDKLLIQNLKSIDDESIMYVFERFYSLLSHLGNQDTNKKLYNDFDKISLEYGKEKEMIIIREDFLNNIGYR